MELVLGDVIERRKLVYGRVVRQHVYPAEGSRRFCKDTLHVGWFADVALNRERLATGPPISSITRSPSLFAGGLIDHDAASSAARPFAIPAPIPLDAPVATATLLLSLLIVPLPSSFGMLQTSPVRFLPGDPGRPSKRHVVTSGGRICPPERSESVQRSPTLSGDEKVWLRLRIGTRAHPSRPRR